jgi:photosystem II stability/assembly factor-like uncharacterized protein
MSCAVIPVYTDKPMLRKIKFLVITILSLLIFSACSPRSPAAPSPTPPVKINPPAPLPTQVSKAYTATPPSPTGTPLAGLTSIRMLDADAGWAWTSSGHLVRTVDAGKTWTDRTPPGGYQYSDPGFFLDAQNAWLPVYLTDSNRFGLLHTTDGGQSWVQYPQGPASGLHFADALHGWAVSADVGAGNVYFSLSQTSDGGKTWAPILVKPPTPEPGLPAGTIHLCNICNDAFYYDPSRLIIVYGDLGSMEPAGSVRMQVSFDLGNTWQALSLPLPQAETAALVSPNPPVFFKDGEGILPIHLLKMIPDGSYGEQKLAFYATSDGGASWSQLPTTLDAVQWSTSIHVDSSQDVYLICGNALCASHDRARTWQTVSSDLDFTSTDTRSVSAIDFIDSTTGWVLVQDNATTSLYQTIDGGLHWALLSPLLVPAAPPAVTIDTSIPTPTSVPTATLEPTPTPNVAYDPQAQADRIKFAPYATWVEVNSTVTANTGKRFVLSAMQNQVMSVSILQGPAFSVEVAGADKKSLTNPLYPQPYWRGGLPATQDYYVTVTSQVAAPFTLRIAINPPGLANQYFEFADPQYLVVLDYSDEFTPINWQMPFTTKGTPLLTLYFIEPSYYYPTTNLIEAALELTATTNPAIVSTCTQPAAQSGETVTGQVTIHGYSFTQSELTGAAAGNRYDQIFYRTAAQGQCFEVIFLIHSANIQNYPAGTVVEFDRVRLLHQFEAVLDTFSAK